MRKNKEQLDELYKKYNLTSEEVQKIVKEKGICILDKEYQWKLIKNLIKKYDN